MVGAIEYRLIARNYDTRSLLTKYSEGSYTCKLGKSTMPSGPGAGSCHPSMIVSTHIARLRGLEVTSSTIVITVSLIGGGKAKLAEET